MTAVFQTELRPLPGKRFGIRPRLGLHSRVERFGQIGPAQRSRSVATQGQRGQVRALTYPFYFPKCGRPVATRSIETSPRGVNPVIRRVRLEAASDGLLG